MIRYLSKSSGKWQGQVPGHLVYVYLAGSDVVTLVPMLALLRGHWPLVSQCLQHCPHLSYIHRYISFNFAAMTQVVSTSLHTVGAVGIGINGLFLSICIWRLIRVLTVSEKIQLDSRMLLHGLLLSFALMEFIYMVSLFIHGG